MEGCTASVRALPSQRGAEELEALTDKAEAKMDDIEYGYDVLCALDNSEEEKYRAAVDKATEEYVATRKAASEALAAARPKAPQATGARIKAVSGGAHCNPSYWGPSLSGYSGSV